MQKSNHQKELRQHHPSRVSSKITKKSQKRPSSNKAAHSHKKLSQIRQNAEKLQRYLKKLKSKKQAAQVSISFFNKITWKPEEKKTENISSSHILECSQALSKQRKNTDPLIKYLLSYRYYEPDSGRLPTEPVPNEFQDCSHYHKIFYVSNWDDKQYLSENISL